MKNLERYNWLETAQNRLYEAKKGADARFKRAALLCAATTLALMVLAYITSGSGRTPASLLERAPYGEDSAEITVNALLNYGDQSLEKELDLRVLPRALSAEDADTLFDECEEWLRGTVIHDGEINGDLSLPADMNGLVTLSWHSSDPARVSEEGQVDLLKLPPACYVSLGVTMNAGDHTRDTGFLLHITEGDASASMERSLAALARTLSDDNSGEKLDLPSENEGMQILWDLPGKTVPWELIPLGLFVILALYFGRYDSVEKELKRQAREFEYEVPAFTLQLILLLNAGLVVSSAFDEILDRNADSTHPFYRALQNVKAKADAENLAFTAELAIFARRSGCRDFIRLTSLIADHTSTGSELAEKLERERAQLWANRLALAKNRTKEAETKLSFPLVLLLLVLVVISAAPAMMTM